MIFWTGWGILVPVVVFLGLIGTQAVCDKAFGPDFYPNSDLAQALAFVIGGVIVAFLGMYLNRKVSIEIDEDTGDGFELKSRHTLFFVPMEYWALITVALGLALAFGP